MNYKEIIKSIKDKNLNPVYFLIGEEPYYIDRICEEFTKNIIPKEEKELNQIIVYGRDTNVEQIISEAKQFPFGSNRKLIIIKEAQQIKNIELLDSYIEKPQETTILVIAYKAKSLDKRKKFGKNLHKKSIVFESRKLYDNEIPKFISSYVEKNGLNIGSKAIAILSEYIGNDLSNITNELDKLMLIIKNGEEISMDIIERHIGISKDYNIFELQNAFAKRQILKVNSIIHHFSKNQQAHHIIPTLSVLFSFFQKIMIYHFLEDKKNAANQLKIHPYFIGQYQIGAKNYTKRQLFSIFQHLKEYDLKSKGVNNNSTDQGELLKELTFKILHS